MYIWNKLWAIHYTAHNYINYVNNGFIINICFRDVEERIQNPTVSALAEFTAQYYIKDDRLITFQRDQFLEQAFKMLK